MKLWLLKLTDQVRSHCGANTGWVIRAESEEDARRIADYESSGLHGMDPGYENEQVRGGRAWLNPMYSTAEELTADGPDGVILNAYTN